MSKTSSLQKKEVCKTLEVLHQNAKMDYLSFAKVLPKVLYSLLKGKKIMEAVSPEMMQSAYIPVSREQGLLLYNVARLSQSKMIVEFGSSFGISSLYLAAAAKDNGGKLVTTEIIPVKCRVTENNLRNAKLNDVAEVWEGDALLTLKTINETVDFLFLDGWKDLYNDVLDLLLPNFKAGSVVIADNINLGSDVKQYLARVQSPNSGFITTLINKNTAFSVYVG